jgi:NAD(P)-dependent dehydrogenase (short-subunit alcohol dehydrogenase family)
LADDFADEIIRRSSHWPMWLRMFSLASRTALSVDGRWRSALRSTTSWMGTIEADRGHVVVPHMRRQGDGRIINIGSVLGFYRPS